MTSESSRTQIIPPPFTSVALDRAKTNWKKRKTETLVGAGIAVASLPFIPVIGPFAALVSGAGLSVIGHSLFQNPESNPPLPTNIVPLQRVEATPEQVAERMFQAFASKLFDPRAISNVREIFHSIAKNDSTALTTHLRTFQSNYPKAFPQVLAGAEGLASVLNRQQETLAVFSTQGKGMDASPAISNKNKKVIASAATASFTAFLLSLYAFLKRALNPPPPPPPPPPAGAGKQKPRLTKPTHISVSDLAQMEELSRAFSQLPYVFQIAQIPILPSAAQIGSSQSQIDAPATQAQSAKKTPLNVANLRAAFERSKQNRRKLQARNDRHVGRAETSSLDPTPVHSELPIDLALPKRSFAAPVQEALNGTDTASLSDSAELCRLDETTLATEIASTNPPTVQVAISQEDPSHFVLSLGSPQESEKFLSALAQTVKAPVFQENAVATATSSLGNIVFSTSFDSSQIHIAVPDLAQMEELSRAFSQLPYVFEVSQDPAIQTALGTASRQGQIDAPATQDQSAKKPPLDVADLRAAFERSKQNRRKLQARNDRHAGRVGTSSLDPTLTPNVAELRAAFDGSKRKLHELGADNDRLAGRPAAPSANPTPVHSELPSLLKEFTFAQDPTFLNASHTAPLLPLSGFPAAKSPSTPLLPMGAPCDNPPSAVFSNTASESFLPEFTKLASAAAVPFLFGQAQKYLKSSANQNPLLSEPLNYSKESACFPDPTRPGETLYMSDSGLIASSTPITIPSPSQDGFFQLTVANIWECPANETTVETTDLNQECSLSEEPWSNVLKSKTRKAWTQVIVPVGKTLGGYAADSIFFMGRIVKNTVVSGGSLSLSLLKGTAYVATEMGKGIHDDVSDLYGKLREDVPIWANNVGWGMKQLGSGLHSLGSWGVDCFQSLTLSSRQSKPQILMSSNNSPETGQLASVSGETREQSGPTATQTVQTAPTTSDTSAQQEPPQTILHSSAQETAETITPPDSGEKREQDDPTDTQTVQTAPTSSDTSTEQDPEQTILHSSAQETVVTVAQPDSGEKREQDDPTDTQTVQTVPTTSETSIQQDPPPTVLHTSAPMFVESNPLAVPLREPESASICLIQSPNPNIFAVQFSTDSQFTEILPFLTDTLKQAPVHRSASSQSIGQELAVRTSSPTPIQFDPIRRIVQFNVEDPEGLKAWFLPLLQSHAERFSSSQAKIPVEENLLSIAPPPPKRKTKRQSRQNPWIESFFAPGIIRTRKTNRLWGGSFTAPFQKESSFQSGTCEALLFPDRTPQLPIAKMATTVQQEQQPVIESVSNEVPILPQERDASQTAIPKEEEPKQETETNQDPASTQSPETIQPERASQIGDEPKPETETNPALAPQTILQQGEAGQIAPSDHGVPPATPQEEAPQNSPQTDSGNEQVPTPPQERDASQSALPKEEEPKEAAETNQGPASTLSSVTIQPETEANQALAPQTVLQQGEPGLPVPSDHGIAQATPQEEAPQNSLQTDSENEQDRPPTISTIEMRAKQDKTKERIKELQEKNDELAGREPQKDQKKNKVDPKAAREALEKSKKAREELQKRNAGHKDIKQ